jgi:hypothetical protein
MMGFVLVFIGAGGVLAVSGFVLLKACACLFDGAGGSLWKFEKRQRLIQGADGFFQRGFLVGRFGFVLEARDVGRGRIEFERYVPSVNCYVERAVTMLVGSELAVFARMRWG